MCYLLVKMCVTPGLWTSLVYLLQCLCVWECLRDSVLKNLAKVVGPGIVPYLEPVVSFRGKKTVFVAMPMLERARLWDQKLSWYIRLANSDQQLCCEGRSSFGPSTSFSGCGLEFLFYNLTWGEKKIHLTIWAAKDASCSCCWFESKACSHTCSPSLPSPK